nr:AAA family ATPase [Aeromonas sp. 1HA1]
MARLLPADLLGLQIFGPHQQQFRFHSGPVFTQVVLADEINRASPPLPETTAAGLAATAATVAPDLPREGMDSDSADRQSRSRASKRGACGSPCSSDNS